MTLLRESVNFQVSRKRSFARARNLSSTSAKVPIKVATLYPLVTPSAAEDDLSRPIGAGGILAAGESRRLELASRVGGQSRARLPLAGSGIVPGEAVGAVWNPSAGAGLVVRTRLPADRRQAPGGAREPGIPGEEERRSIGILQRMTIRGGPRETAPVGVERLHRIGPLARGEGAGFAVQPRVGGLVASVGPFPVSRGRGDHANAECIAAVPGAINPLGESGSLEVEPAIHIGVGVGIGMGSAELNLAHFPNVDRGRTERKAGGRENESQHDTNRVTPPAAPLCADCADAPLETMLLRMEMGHPWTQTCLLYT